MTEFIRKHIIFLVFAFYVILAVVATWPYVLHPFNTIPAPVGGDVASSIAKYDAIKLQHANPFTTQRLTSIAAPEGLQANIGVDRVSFLSVGFLWIGSLITNPVAIHAFETFSGYLLTAFLMYLFIRRVLRSDGPAIVAGLIFGFSPHMYSIARAAPTYTHMWLIILPIWAFWELSQRLDRNRWYLVAGLSVLPALFWTPYFGLHALVLAAAAFLVVAIIAVRSQKKSIKKYLLRFGMIAAVWLVGLASYVLIGITSPSTEVPVRTALETYEQAAQPIMYVTPGYFSVWGAGVHHRLLGVFPTLSDLNLYIGLSTLTLAGIGIWALRTHRKRGRVAVNQHHESVLYLGVISLVAAVACFTFSLRPEVTLFGIHIPTPNKVVTTLVPALRAGQRFVMPLMGLSAILAALGVYHLTEVRRTALGRRFVLVVVILIVMFDLFSLPPQAATVLASTPSLRVLREQPNGLVATYQEGSLLNFPAQWACVLQQEHKHPIINDCGLGRPLEDPAQTTPLLTKLQSLPVCEQVSNLVNYNVDYVIVSATDNKLRNCLKNRHPLASDSQLLIYRL